MSLKKILAAALLATFASANYPVADVKVAKGNEVKKFSEDAVNSKMVVLEPNEKLVYRYEIRARDVGAFLLLLDGKAEKKEEGLEIKASAYLDGRQIAESESSVNEVYYKRIDLGKDFKGKHSLDLFLFCNDGKVYEDHAFVIAK